MSLQSKKQEQIDVLDLIIQTQLDYLDRLDKLIGFLDLAVTNLGKVIDIMFNRVTEKYLNGEDNRLVYK